MAQPVEVAAGSAFRSTTTARSVTTGAPPAVPRSRPSAVLPPRGVAPTPGAGRACSGGPAAGRRPCRARSPVAADGISPTTSRPAWPAREPHHPVRPRTRGPARPTGWLRSSTDRRLPPPRRDPGRQFPSPPVPVSAYPGSVAPPLVVRSARLLHSSPRLPRRSRTLSCRPRPSSSRVWLPLRAVRPGRALPVRPFGAHGRPAPLPSTKSDSSRRFRARHRARGSPCW